LFKPAGLANSVESFTANPATFADASGKSFSNSVEIPFKRLRSFELF